MSVLEQPVYATDGYKPFGQFTLRDVEARASELKAAAGWGPTAKVGGVARAWAELAQTMTRAGAQTVGELELAVVTEFAARLWVVPPGGSLLG